MLIGGIVLGLLAGLAAGGSLANLGIVRLRWVALLFTAVVVRFTTEAALGANIELVRLLQLPLFTLAYGMLLVGLWVNRTQPGMSLAFVGVLSNAVVIVANGGFMPIWLPSLAAAGFGPEAVNTGFHVTIGPALDTNFMLRFGPLGDIIPIPLPLIRNVASIGDLFLTAGLAFFLFATVVREPQELDEEGAEAVRRRLDGLAGAARLPRSVEEAIGARRVRAETGLTAGLSDAAVLERPTVLGGSRAGLSAPALAPLPDDGGTIADRRPGAATELLAAAMTPATAGAAGGSDTAIALSADGVAIPLPRPEVFERARRHPYVRLALNGSFSALWAGQLISLFGDRIHQIALAFLVYNTTGSALAVGLVFVAATLPNLLISPIAGTFVDRWDQQEVLVVSDILRAATVLIVPVAAVTNVALIYPLTFALTTISIFFRPARVAILPRIVREDELLPANSAMWVGETMADVIGYPLAGLFVAFLGAALPLAFWVDAATYITSAVLLWTIVVPPLRRTLADEAAAKKRAFFAELREGWAFLRAESTLLANTLQATVAQFTVGILTALTAVYASAVVRGTTFDAEAVYAFLETGIGFGNLIGGFILGLVGARISRGRTVIVGYTMWGLCIAVLGLTDNLPAALGLMFGSGIANMIFLIPSQTLFQERTPAELMGRVLGFRYALVFGSMTVAMAAGGILGEVFGVAPVFAVFGLVTTAAGLAGLFVPAVRDA